MCVCVIMSKKSTKRLVYVLSPSGSSSGHSLGVNSLAIDPRSNESSNGCLYSAGRDGIIHTWDLHGDQNTTPGKKVQIHTNWVNDIVLTHDYNKVASCSSDLSVKLWDPSSNVQTLVGQHRDYVKCLNTPGNSSNWLLSGGLDRRIVGWDINEHRGEMFSIEPESDDPKLSVYALSLNKAANPIIGAGGPEAVVRLYDSRSTSQIVKFVGHTDNIRSILISDDGEWVLSGSSDSTIKLWSVTAGRLLHTFDMHDDSVWSLSSDHPSLDVFYSSDRSGIVAKTDLSLCDSSLLNVDDAYSAILFNEHQGVAKMVNHDGYVWTATSNSWIHRWKDFDTAKYRSTSASITPNTSESKLSTMFSNAANLTPTTNGGGSSTAGTPTKETDNTTTNFKRLDGTPVVLDNKNLDGSYIDPEKPVVPMYKNPVETLEGHIGIIKHRLLTDKLRVLTLDTSGEVTLWDLMKCVPIKSFGTSLDIDTLAEEFNVYGSNKMSSVSNWCTVTTRTGEVYVSLESSTCFDAEVYADELEDFEDELKDINFREDHRINLGKWIIRNLMCDFVTQEIEEDKDHRRAQKRLHQQQGGDQTVNSSSASVSTVSSDPNYHPHSQTYQSNTNTHSSSSATNDSESSTTAEIIKSVPIPAAAADTNNDNDVNSSSLTPNSKGKFMDKLRGFGKSKNKDKTGGSSNVTSNTATSNNNSNANGATTNNNTTTTTTTATTTSSTTANRAELSFTELVESLRTKTKSFNQSPFTPPNPEEAPVLPIPKETKILISEQSPGSGGTVDLYRGTIGSAGVDREDIREVIPEWIGRVLLTSELPNKEATKVGFTLQPYTPGQDPEPPGGGNLRLTAYQMLRARKILLYLVERLGEHAGPPESFELYCQGKLITPTMSLASIRTRIWRSGGDVIIKYRKK